MSEPTPAVWLTFDNLGEASALQRGEWTGRVPLGSDPSVTEALPRLLCQLDDHALEATFFVEALNCELYPEALREIVSRGHELGVHGWRHERWSALEPGAERELLQRCRAAFARLGLRADGFRPPGGEPTAATEALLNELGYRWWSSVQGADSGPACVPFDWELVDAYHLMERFGPLRVARGDPLEPLTAAAAADRLAAAIEHSAARQVPIVVVLHPFLTLEPDWERGVQRVLSLLSALRGAGRVRILRTPVPVRAPEPAPAPGPAARGLE
ncbi:MAG: polysaccharide deacetylase family protein, partial [Solirubrobacteraceae bacterium]